MKVIVALRDKVSNTFLVPFFVPAVGVALRDLQDEAERNKEFVVAKHPMDFAVYEIGVYNEIAGRIEPCEPKLVIECGALFSKE